MLLNRKSAAKLRTGEGPTTIPELGVETSVSKWWASEQDEDIVCALLKSKGVRKHRVGVANLYVYGLHNTHISEHNGSSACTKATPLS
nr:MAG TPA: hypothetical protein [Caudoviricetes sp.]